MKAVKIVLLAMAGMAAIMATAIAYLAIGHHHGHVRLSPPKALVAEVGFAWSFVFALSALAIGSFKSE